MRDTREDVLIDLKVNGVVKAQYPLTPTGESDDNGNPCVAGCIFDGHRGQYIYGAIVALAIQYGYKPERLNVNGAHNRKPWGDREADDYVIETADDAEVYLNTLVPDGYSFGWSDGEYFLANDAWWSLDS
jgi:hypothetical protein